MKSKWIRRILAPEYVSLALTFQAIASEYLADPKASFIGSQVARREGAAPYAVLVSAMRLTGETNAQRADFTKSALLRNLTIAEQLGCLTDAEIEEMRRYSRTS